MRFDGSKLSEVLDTQGRSVRWLAAQIGYHESTLSRMINGSQPFTRKAAEAVAPVLGIPVSFLEADDATPEPEPAETAAAS